jgi:hypothetical protein
LKLREETKLSTARAKRYSFLTFHLPKLKLRRIIKPTSQSIAEDVLSTCTQIVVRGLKVPLEIDLGLDLVKYVLPFGWSMAIFDYRGSGVSDGEYTSMGVN